VGKYTRRKATRRRVAAAPGSLVTPAYVACQPSVWVPDLDNAHLKDAARGLTSIGYPLHPPAPPVHHP
jgi:hypothetical protein